MMFLLYFLCVIHLFSFPFSSRSLHPKFGIIIHQGQYGHSGPVADGPALEALIAQQRDADERAKAKRRRAAEASERAAAQARKEAQAAAAAMPSGFRQV
jgi:hypothetical protein